MSYHSHVAVDFVLYGVGSGKTFQVDSARGILVPLSEALVIRVCETNKQLMDFGFPSTTSDKWPRYCLSIADTKLISMIFSHLVSARTVVSNNHGIHALVAEKESERMERYVAGLDSPIHDLIEVLRYHPDAALSPTLKRVAKDFAEKTTKE